MAIRLAEHEAAPRHEGDYRERLDALQRRLAHAQVALIVHRRRAMIVLEGWDAAGKGGTIQRMTAGWDARGVRVHPIGSLSDHERARHYLARFWERVPAAGEIAVFDRSWYGRVLVERVDGLVDRAGWRRAYDEINEFEAQQRDGGTTIVKLFLHISDEEQERRFRARLDHPWKRWKLTAAELHNRARRADYVVAVEEMLARTDSRWAPWRVIDAGRKKFARLAALTAIADALERAVPMQPPPADPAVAAWACAQFGMELG